jgi:hypothetical protein
MEIANIVGTIIRTRRKMYIHMSEGTPERQGASFPTFRKQPDVPEPRQHRSAERDDHWARQGKTLDA